MTLTALPLPLPSGLLLPFLSFVADQSIAAAPVETRLEPETRQEGGNGVGTYFFEHTRPHSIAILWPFSFRLLPLFFAPTTTMRRADCYCSPASPITPSPSPLLGRSFTDLLPFPSWTI